MALACALREDAEERKLKQRGRDQFVLCPFLRPRERERKSESGERVFFFLLDLVFSFTSVALRPAPRPRRSNPLEEKNVSTIV